MGLKDTIQILDVIEKRDARYCDRLLRECQVSSTEILLSRKGVEELCSFERFQCIDALWLNNNALSRVQGLDTNVQIKALYLHCNRINTLKGSLQKLHHIRMLTLNSNMLQDLIATLPLLEHLHCLEELGASPCLSANTTLPSLPHECCCRASRLWPLCRVSSFLLEAARP